MIKKTITYFDFDGNQRTEDFYFNLTKAELSEMTLTTEGGLDVLLKKIVNEKDVAQMVTYFKTILLKSYGVKSADGRKFTKNAENIEDFISTPAYDILFMELTSDAKSAAAFIQGVLPSDLVASSQLDITSLIEKNKID